LIHRPRRLGALILATALLAAACGSTASHSPSGSTTGGTGASAQASDGSGESIACETGSVTAAGSTALQPLVDKAGKDYVAACGGAQIQVQGGGSGTGLTQVSQGAVQIGNSDVTAESKSISGLTDHIVAKQGWIMVVNPDVKGVTSLTRQQATDIWTGKVTNWKDVGGNDESIVLVLRPASSGTRATFKKLVLGGADEAAGTALTEDSNGAVAQAVQQTPGATSVIGLAYYEQNRANLSATRLDGVDATLANIQNGDYKLQAFGHMYTKGRADGLARAFIDYLATPEAQQIAAGLFFAPPE